MPIPPTSSLMHAMEPQTILVRQIGQSATEFLQLFAADRQVNRAVGFGVCLFGFVHPGGSLRLVPAYLIARAVRDTRGQIAFQTSRQTKHFDRFDKAEKTS
jgi:hypothetical protein